MCGGKRLKRGRGSPPEALTRQFCCDVAAALNIDKPVMREKVMYAEDTNHIIFHVCVSKKHLVQEPASRSGQDGRFTVCGRKGGSV